MSVATALADMRNAILDLQAADYNTYARPLKKLALALGDDDLRSVNDGLKDGVDFDKWEAENTRGRGFGGESLDWPLEKEKELGLSLILIERGAADPNWFMNFGHRFYNNGSKLIAGIRKMTAAVIIPFERDYRNYVLQETAVKTVAEEASSMPPPIIDRTKVFIVHGQDDLAKITLARVIESQGLEAVILHEQVSKGMSIPEKLTHYGKVGFAVVLLTPDDLGRRKTDAAEKPRARQNVILELGYFLGALGRDRVFALLKDEIEMPSDYVGVVYEKMDDAGAWKTRLGRELEAAGFDIDFKKISR